MEMEVQDSDALRCITMESGAQCVTTTGTLTMAMLFAACLATLTPLKSTPEQNMVRGLGKYGLIMYNVKETNIICPCAHTIRGEQIIVAIRKMLGWFAPLLKVNLKP